MYCCCSDCCCNTTEPELVAAPIKIKPQKQANTAKLTMNLKNYFSSLPSTSQSTAKKPEKQSLYQGVTQGTGDDDLTCNIRDSLEKAQGAEITPDKEKDKLGKGDLYESNHRSDATANPYGSMRGSHGGLANSHTHDPIQSQLNSFYNANDPNAKRITEKVAEQYRNADVAAIKAEFGYGEGKDYLYDYKNADKDVSYYSTNSQKNQTPIKGRDSGIIPNENFQQQDGRGSASNDVLGRDSAKNDDANGGGRDSFKDNNVDGGRDSTNNNDANGGGRDSANNKDDIYGKGSTSNNNPLGRDSHNSANHEQQPNSDAKESNNFNSNDVYKKYIDLVESHSKSKGRYGDDSTYVSEFPSGNKAEPRKSYNDQGVQIGPENNSRYVQTGEDMNIQAGDGLVDPNQNGPNQNNNDHLSPKDSKQEDAELEEIMKRYGQGSGRNATNDIPGRDFSMTDGANNQQEGENKLRSSHGGQSDQFRGSFGSKGPSRDVSPDGFGFDKTGQSGSDQAGFMSSNPFSMSGGNQQFDRTGGSDQAGFRQSNQFSMSGGGYNQSENQGGNDQDVQPRNFEMNQEVQDHPENPRESYNSYEVNPRHPNSRSQSPENKQGGGDNNNNKKKGGEKLNDKNIKIIGDAHLKNAMDISTVYSEHKGARMYTNHKLIDINRIIPPEMKNTVLTNPDLIIIEGELQKYKPGIKFSHVPRWVQVTMTELRYYKSRWSANCWDEKPLFTIPFEELKGIFRVNMKLPKGMKHESLNTPQKGKPGVKKNDKLYHFEIFNHHNIIAYEDELQQNVMDQNTSNYYLTPENEDPSKHHRSSMDHSKSQHSQFKQIKQDHLMPSPAKGRGERGSYAKRHEASRDSADSGHGKHSRNDSKSHFHHDHQSSRTSKLRQSQESIQVFNTEKHDQIQTNKAPVYTFLKRIDDLASWSGREKEWFYSEKRLLFSTYSLKEREIWLSVLNWVWDSHN